MKKIGIIIILLLQSLNASNNIRHFRISLENPPIFEKRKELGKREMEDSKITLQNFVNDVGFNIIGDVNQSNLILYRQEYLALPNNLKNSIVKITITTQNLNEVCGFRTPFKVKGCALSDTNEIFLDATYRYGDLRHESIHTYSYQNDRVDSESFWNAYANEGNNISIQNGNVHNVYEYFVSAYLLYLSSPNKLATIAPLTYGYFLSC